jgi:hypothetical protein
LERRGGVDEDVAGVFAAVAALAFGELRPPRACRGVRTRPRYVPSLLPFVPEHIIRIREVVHLTLQLQFFR